MNKCFKYYNKFQNCLIIIKFLIVCIILQWILTAIPNLNTYDPNAPIPHKPGIQILQFSSHFSHSIL